MSTSEPHPIDRSPNASAPRPLLFGRFLNWFWQRGAVAETNRLYPEPSERTARLWQRAQAASEIASSACPPGERLEFPRDAPAAELYRQSVYWALCALYASPEVRAQDSPSVWKALDDPTCRPLLDRFERRDFLVGLLREGTFLDFAELSATEQANAVEDLRGLSKLLLGKSVERTRALERLYVRRLGRACLVLLAAALLVAGFFWLRGVQEARSDLARGKPWRASSKYVEYGCLSPAQSCPESPNMFFHTDDEASPWVEFDLGAAQKFSTVVVTNRTEFAERAVPLILEYSEDHSHWQQIASQDDTFSTWRASFAPVTARWARLRVNRRTWLHLARVRILP